MSFRPCTLGLNDGVASRRRGGDAELEVTVSSSLLLSLPFSLFLSLSELNAAASPACYLAFRTVLLDVFLWVGSASLRVCHRRLRGK